jgi:uncharacterized protein (DUF58 family)
MQWLTSKTVIKTYLIATLIVGMMVSPFPQFTLAIALLILQLYTTYKPIAPTKNTALLLGTLILAPLTLTSLVGNLLSGLLIIPAIHLLDVNLRENAQTQRLQPQKRTRAPTLELKAAITALTVILAVSLLLYNWEIFSATTALMIYFATIVTLNIHRTPKKSIQESKTWSRILAGETEEKTITLSTATKQILYAKITPLQQWVKIKQQNFTITKKGNISVDLIFTPPLAGPTQIKLQIAMLDLRGLIQTNQTLEPINLQVIPKAKYAQWLAKKFLDQTASGTASTQAALTIRSYKAANQGGEYYGSRLYQPGDRLKEVDWKHTCMLGKLTIKEYAGAHGQPVIIAADLTVKNEEDADKLSYNIVISALTSATESLPTGLACFNQKEIIAAYAPINPRETLKKTLQITEKITLAETKKRITNPRENTRVKRVLMEPNDSEIKLLKFTEVLEFKYQASYIEVKKHPATEALSKSVELTSAPVMITVASSESSNSEALTIILERLKTQGYSIVTL